LKLQVRAYIGINDKKAKDFVICRCRMGRNSTGSRCFGPNELGLNSAEEGIVYDFQSLVLQIKVMTQVH
jgi:hypothetical protein